VDYLVNVTEPETEMMLETPFPLDYFLPKFKKMFYRGVLFPVSAGMVLHK
jgi:hypothetical protein